MPTSPPLIASPADDPVSTVQEVLKCKWAMLIMEAIATGRHRPSALERSIDGLSHKMLHQRLAKLIRLHLVERHPVGDKAQRVDYHLTRLGTAVVAIIAHIRDLRVHLPEGETTVAPS